MWGGLWRPRLCIAFTEVPGGAPCRLLVESDGVAEQGVDDVGVAIKLLVDHEGQDAHLGGAAVVQLDGGLLGDGGLVPLGELQALHLDVRCHSAVAELDQADEGNDLGNARAGDGVKGSKAVLHLAEGQAVSDIAGESVASRGHQVAEDGKHGDAAVLVLDVPEAVESVLVGLGEETQRIPEAEGGLGADGVLEAHAQGGCGGDLARGGEGGGADEGSEDDDSAEHDWSID
mmetsp:Transcript_25329/g.56087  ORF Transcript_25329/g.56087 Transcript_25329/m.56087 type:complete len:231 (-) Transcript_25329:40-732(-)